MNETHKQVTLSIICPCFNEEAAIPLFMEAIIPILNESRKSYEIIFINDGSTDGTLQVLMNEKQQFNFIRIINLSRNFGKEAALSAGLCKALGDAVIPIDVDLQDPPELILEFIKKWEAGDDVVLAKRVDRTADTLAKRLSAEFFYKVHNKISEITIPENVGDYRLMSKRVVDAINKLPENQRFMKGLFAWAGYKTSFVEYKRQIRSAGETSFNGWKLWNFALEGITSFSTAPLKIWLYVGVFISVALIFLWLYNH